MRGRRSMRVSLVSVRMEVDRIPRGSRPEAGFAGREASRNALGIRGRRRGRAGEPWVPTRLTSRGLRAARPPGSSADEIPTIGSPRPEETSARTFGSSKCVVASTIAFARVSGSPDLKMPEPTNTPSAPSCMQSEASAGVAMPPAVNVTTGRRPFSATQRTSSYGARCSFAAAYSSSSRAAWSCRIAPKTARMWVTALTMSPVPASPFVRIIAAPSAIRRSASPRFVAPHTNGIVNCHLSTWCWTSAGVRTSDSST